MSDQFDCIVVGAGFSGLVAAKHLRDAGKTVLVLEARDRVGGRTEPGSLAGLTIDLGGMWLGPTQTRLAELADHYAVARYPTWLEGEGVIALDEASVRVEGDEIETAVSEEELIELATMYGEIETLTETLDPARPWAHSQAEALDAVTVESWLESKGAGPRIRTLFRLVCRSLFCAEAGELSLLYFLFYVKSGGGLDVLISQSEGGAQNLLFEGGLHQIAGRLAKELGDAIRLNAPVTAIRNEDGRVVVSAGEDQFSGAYLIMAAPPGPTNRIAFFPDLPQRKRALMRRQPMGSCIKCWVAYERPFWRAQGLNGLVLNDLAPFTPMMDATPPSSNFGVLAGFFDADAAITWSEKTPEERRAAVVQEVVRQFGEEGANPIDYAERDWTAERYSEGCYGGYMGPGTLTRYGRMLREPVGRIHWAGTETSEIWAGYVDGAVRSGDRAAEEVLARLNAN